MTPFQFYIRLEGYFEKVKKNNIVNLYTLNAIRNLFGDNGTITFDEIFNVDVQEWLTREDFESMEEYQEYLKTEYVPWMKENKGIDIEV